MKNSVENGYFLEISMVFLRTFLPLQKVLTNVFCIYYFTFKALIIPFKANDYTVWRVQFE